MKLSDMKVGQKVSALVEGYPNPGYYVVQRDFKFGVGIWRFSFKKGQLLQWENAHDGNMIYQWEPQAKVWQSRDLRKFGAGLHLDNYAVVERITLGEQWHANTKPIGRSELNKLITSQLAVGENMKVGQKVSAKSSDLVITQQKGGPIQFWSGSRWVSEYPDAEKYPNMAAAKKANLKAKGDIMENYGMDDERVVGKLSELKVGQKTCVKKQVKAGWLARELEPKNKQLVPRLAGQLDYDINQAFAFCVALLEDVNAHDEAKYMNTYFNKMLGIIENEGEAV
jgi:hypothetical protein